MGTTENPQVAESKAKARSGSRDFLRGGALCAMTMAVVAAGLLAGCSSSSDFSTAAPVDTELSAHLNAQPYAATLNQRGIKRMAIRCKYNGGGGYSLDILFEEIGEVQYISSKNRCNTLTSLTIVPTKSGLQAHTNYRYDPALIDAQLQKVIARTNKLTLNTELTKHYAAQPYAQLLAKRQVRNIELKCSEPYLGTTRWYQDFDYKFGVEAAEPTGECVYGTKVKLVSATVVDGIEVFTTADVSTEELDRQLNSIVTATDVMKAL